MDDRLNFHFNPIYHQKGQKSFEKLLNVDSEMNTYRKDLDYFENKIEDEISTYLVNQKKTLVKHHVKQVIASNK